MDTGLFNPLFLRTCYKQLKAVIVTRKKKTWNLEMSMYIEVEVWKKLETEFEQTL